MVKKYITYMLVTVLLTLTACGTAAAPPIRVDMRANPDVIYQPDRPAVADGQLIPFEMGPAKPDNYAYDIVYHLQDKAIVDSSPVQPVADQAVTPPPVDVLTPFDTNVPPPALPVSCSASGVVGHQWIDPDGAGGFPAEEVWCDAGGWRSILWPDLLGSAGIARKMDPQIEMLDIGFTSGYVDGELYYDWYLIGPGGGRWALRYWGLGPAVSIYTTLLMRHPGWNITSVRVLVVGQGSASTQASFEAAGVDASGWSIAKVAGGVGGWNGAEDIYCYGFGGVGLFDPRWLEVMVPKPSPIMGCLDPVFLKHLSPSDIHPGLGVEIVGMPVQVAGSGLLRLEGEAGVSSVGGSWVGVVVLGIWVK